MEELELQQKKDELIARIPLLEPIHSPNYEEVMDQMNTLVWEEMEDPMTMAQAAEDRRNAENGQQGQTAVAASGSGVDDADDWSAPGDGESTNLVDATPTMRLDRSVLKFIEKNCIGKTVQRDRQDPLYNYNRGKTSGGVMRTRITTVEEYRPGNLVALIDVSGSVDNMY